MSLELRCARPIASMQGWTRRNPNPAIRESFGMTVSLSNVHYLSLYSRVQNRLRLPLPKRSLCIDHFIVSCFSVPTPYVFAAPFFRFFFFLRTDKYIHSSKGSISQQKNYKPGQEVPTETCLAFPSPPSKDAPINIVGAGIFALSTALHLARRGYKNVTIFDKQPYDATLYSYLDGCDAASADINKIVRSAYGSQVAYQALTFDALEQWRKHATTSSRAASTRRRACRRGTACSTTPAT